MGRRRILPLTLTVLLLTLTLTSPAQGGVSIKLNGTDLSFPVAPINEEGRLLVPMRTIFEAMGAEIEWNGEAQEVTATTADGTVVWLKIGRRVGRVGDRAAFLDVPPKIVEGSTLVPLRFVAESLGAQVSWDGATETVTITRREGPLPSAGAPQSAEDLLEIALPATVLIATDSLQGVGVGAGFFLNDQGMIVTAYHLLEDIDLAEVWTHDGKAHILTKILAADPRADIAIVQTTAKGYPVLPLAAELSMKPGHKVVTVGHPGALEWSVSEGLLSATDRMIEGLPWIQHTAPMSGGNSGGPLVSLSTGQVVGLNTFLLVGEAVQNLNFAAPATTIAEVYNRGGTAGLTLPGRLTAETILPPPADLAPAGPEKPPVTVTGEWLAPRGDLMNRGVAPEAPGTLLEYLWSQDHVVHSGRLLLSDSILYAVDTLSSGTLTAMEAGTGKRLWEQRLARTATAAVAGPLGVYLTEIGFAVSAFKSDGTTLWSQPILATTMPVLVDDRLYVGDSKGVIRALKADTGEEVWNLPLGSTRFSGAPAVYRGMLLMPADGQVYAIDTQSGALVRTYPVRMPTLSAIMVDHDLLYVSGYDGLMAFSLESGELQWEARIGLIFSPPASGGGLVVVTNLDNRLYAFDAKSGKQAWVQIGGGRGAPVIAGPLLYVGVPTGGLGVFDLATGKRQALLLPGIQSSLTPVITNEVIFISANQWGIHALIKRQL